jgi:hypothetical protein
MRYRATFVLALGVLAALTAGYVQAEPDSGKQVEVVNTADQAVPVAVQGNPTVSVASTAGSPVHVQLAREPFQQYVSGGGAPTSGFPACDRVELPSQGVVTIEGLTISHILVPAGQTPEIALRAEWRIDESTLKTQTIAAHADLEPAANSNPNLDHYRGFGQALFHTASDDGTAEFVAVCSQNAVQFEGYVSGYVQ